MTPVPTLMVLTHDAMGDGANGPAHPPVKQLISLRAMPNLVVLRPADANEVVEAYRHVMQLRHQPAAIFLSRQALPTFDRKRYAPAAGLQNIHTCKTTIEAKGGHDGRLETGQ